MSPFDDVDFATMPATRLVLEQTFYQAQVGYHATELETAREGLRLVTEALATERGEAA